MGRIFNGRRMVAAGCAMQFVQSCLLLQAFGAYVAALRDDRGWSKTELAGAAALHQMEAAILGPVLGWFLDRFGPRGVIRTGVFIMGFGFMALSFVDGLIAFYCVFLVVATGSSLMGFFPLNVALIHWFERKRARALSSMQVGMALGGLAVPLIAFSLASYGWRATAFASGVIVIALGYPLSRVIRNKPSEYGEVVDGVRGPPREEKSVQNEKPEPVTRDFTAREALRTSAFWLISLGHGFSLLVVTAVNVHAITHMKEGLGYSIEQAALVITLMTAFQLGGIATGWWIGDRYSKRLLSAACMFGHGAGLLCLTYATGLGWLVAFAALHGYAWGLRGPFMQAIRADYFGTSAIGMILGLSFLIIVVGQIGGPLIAGLIADAKGSYKEGFTIIAVLAGLGSVFFLLARKPQRPLRSES
jgi:sugar phosphate permease